MRLGAAQESIPGRVFCLHAVSSLGKRMISGRERNRDAVVIVAFAERHWNYSQGQKGEGGGEVFRFLGNSSSRRKRYAISTSRRRRLRAIRL